MQKTLVVEYLQLIFYRKCEYFIHKVKLSDVFGRSLPINGIGTTDVAHFISHC